MARRVNPEGAGPVVVDVLNITGTETYTQDPLPLMPEPAPVVEPVSPPPAPTRPLPESQLTPEQRRIRELEDVLAREMGRKDPDSEPDSITVPGADDNILIHFLEDGLTALGKVWYRGQELEFARDSAAYRDTCDRYGRTWLDLRRDESRQIDKWGRVMFREGPWPGKPLNAMADATFEALKPISGSQRVAPSAEELRAAAQKAEQAGRAAPRLPLR